MRRCHLHQSRLLHDRKGKGGGLIVSLLEFRDPNDQTFACPDLGCQQSRTEHHPRVQSTQQPIFPPRNQQIARAKTLTKSKSQKRLQVGFIMTRMLSDACPKLASVVILCRRDGEDV